jgi:hypothetical protein
MSGHVARIGVMGNAHDVSVEKSERKRTLERRRLRWDDKRCIQIRE